MSGITDPTSTLPPPKIMYESVGRARAGKAMALPPSDLGDFLRFRPIAKRPYDVVIHGCVVMTGWSFPVRMGKGRRIWLRNLRMCLAPVGAFLLQRCVGCGWSKWVEQATAEGESHVVCPQCKAKPSPVKCATWHTFGVCDQCTGEVLDECPFERTPLKDELQVASHVPTG